MMSITWYTPVSGKVNTGVFKLEVSLVMVVTPNNRLETRRISIGLETASKVEVRSGLNEGDMVVIGNRSGLQPGQEVKPKVTKMSAAS